MISAATSNRKLQISGTFKRIQLRIKQSNTQTTPEFNALLKRYKRELLAETECLDNKYDHPLRAAYALEAVIIKQSQANLDEFQHVATDSKFNPRARAIAWGLLASLVFTSMVVLLVLAGLSAAPATIIAGGVGYAAGLGIMISIPLGYQATTIKLESYVPVTQAVATGKEVHAGLLRFFPPVAGGTPERQAVQGMQLGHTR